MTNKKLWWGYKHINGSYQAKRYFGKIDIEEAEESPFCAKVTQPFEAETREEALKKVEEITNSTDWTAEREKQKEIIIRYFD